MSSRSPTDPWGEPDPKALEVRSSGVLLTSIRPAAEPPPANPLQLLAKAREKFSLGDFSSTLELATQVLSLEPSNSLALGLKRDSEKSLLSMFESKIGVLTQVPQVKVDLSEVIWLNLDSRAGFVLSQIDGVISFDDLFSLSGMSRLETARILVQLKDSGVID